MLSIISIVAPGERQGRGCSRLARSESRSWRCADKKEEEAGRPAKSGRRQGGRRQEAGWPPEVVAGEEEAG